MKLKKLISLATVVCMAIPFAADVTELSEKNTSNYVSAAVAYDDDLVLRYNTMAGTASSGNAWNNSESFYRALPLGNGRIGAMVYGNCPNEIIDLNECTVWSSGPGNNNKKGAASYLAQVQSLLASGKYAEANRIIGQNMIGGGQAKYQMVGSLRLALGHENVSDYSRQLDMNDAVAVTTYTYNGKKYKRETFVSYPDQIMVTRITCDKPGSVSLTADYTNVLNGTVTSDGNDTIVANGHGDGDLGIGGAVYFSSRSKFINENGSVNSANGKVNVTGADSLLILTSVRTNYIDYKTCNGDEKGDALADISKKSSLSYDTLYHNHAEDYQELFKRVDIDLGGDSSITNSKTVPTRISEFGKTNDPKMVKTLFQFGRYLMISASRDAQPMNLQGIWNKYMAPAWGSKATTNINYEMNYWPAFTTNLAECFEPFVEKAKSLQEAGNITAKEHYGISEGWVLHHNTDLWNRSAPIDGTWGQWPVGGAWISNMLYDAYRFNQDKSYLEDIYPVIKGSASFLNQLMKPATINNQEYMVISPSASPELAIPGYAYDDSVYCGYSITMDNGICRELFKDVSEASEILGRDTQLKNQLQSKLTLIRPETIGRWGQIQEWADDLDNKDEKHRHISHMYALYPGNEITPSENKTSANAAAVTLNARGDAGTGWSEAWKLNCWARLGDGAHAYQLIKLLITPVDGSESGRLYENLWDAHPPFQIDGNFGFTSGVAEMLLQSQNDTIELLPALPTQWSTGHANGLCARGNFEITKMNWADGKLNFVSVLSKSGGVCSLRYKGMQLSFDTQAGEEYSLNGNLQFSTDTQKLQNIAKNKKVTASGEATDGKAAYAVDGNNKTKWCHMDGLSDEWIQIDLGDTYEIGRWTAKFAGISEDVAYNPRDFKLQSSINGEDWTDIDTVYGNTKSVINRNVDKFTGRYVRLYFITSTQNNQGGARLYDIALFGYSEEPEAPESAYKTIYADSAAFTYGDIQTESHDDGSSNIGYISDESYVMFRNIDFGNGPSGLIISAASDTEGGTVEVRTDGTDGPLLASCRIGNTGGWQEYQTVKSDTTQCNGVKDVYLVFKGDDGYLFNIDWLRFTGAKGDSNCNGKIDIVDYILIKSQLVSGEDKLSEVALSNADMNDDNSVDISDAVLLGKLMINK